ncbi:uncharacterized protein [Asterias amurensis]|uniref:uncharacterized protein n=1 Tax=Asterias amurensis TaxID=7602 RepID=UPI003AB32093
MVWETVRKMKMMVHPMMKKTMRLPFLRPHLHPETKTKPYQQMMQSSQGSAKLKDLDGLGDDEEEDEDGSSDDEEDDEIEKANRLSPETPPSSRNKLAAETPLSDGVYLSRSRCLM